jgi:hypothetical protein
LNQGEFIYGLCIHDGLQNAIQGIDLGGVSYWRSQVN